MARRSGIFKVGRKKADAWFALSLISPAALIVIIVVLAPLLYAFFLSLNKAGIIVVAGRGGVHTQFVGLKNYLYFLNDSSFWYSVRVTLYFTVTSLFVELIAGTIIALILNEPFRGRGIVRALIILPWAVPTVVNARMWGLIYEPHPYGAMNGLMTAVGLQGPKDAVNFLSPIPVLQNVPIVGKITTWIGATQAINWIIVGDSWKVIPVVALLTLAGLQTIPRELYEAAEVDGASVWQRFWKITVPQLRPIILVILVYRTMELFRVFDILYILMAYTIPVLAIKTFQQAFVFGLFGRGAAIAFLIGLLITGVAFIYIKLIEVGE